ncbi:MAG: Na/Pi cotransporter family protein [Gammaproteobacteria bacterium]|uniref:Na/Pi cotransporter family protein n=1 Tax=Pseudomaricurvus alcaniphilus TaxID=1166482 RepID=UPI00140C115A|nr:Na/Pi cotransporter family protein [Pseudomaricurvus alcaniphilus]MBR9909758.1 Na/Pi cotransporter family protein [Gammaproteobacteria bacterium]NHN38477.1 Na/Pi cotransporter family protein [Pseudomaricurvus alcaniphilus]
MENIHILMAGLTAIILFIFGLENFSREIERISGERFRKSLARATRVPLAGVLIGAVVTAFIQSSSATSVITISLVNAGVLSFKSSIGIIFGSNIGTTVTAQLVAFKLTAYAPLIIIIGFALSLTRNRYSIFGRTIFYFGFVFFSLNLISASLQPLQNNDALIQLLTQPQNPLFAILFGCLFTAVVQSSSVTTGLAIIFTQQGILSLENAVPLIMGANIGTTATALLAVFSMDIAAKKTALAHFFFNVGGVLIFTPVLLVFGDRLREVTMDPAIALANIHLIFNVVTSLIFIVLISPFGKAVDALLGEGKMDFERLPLPVYDKDQNFNQIRENLETDGQQLLKFLQENYSTVTLSIETNYKGIYDAAEKRLEYIRFVKKEYMSYFSKIVTTVTDQQDSRELIRIINQFDYLFQIHDSICDLFETKKVMQEHFLELKSDILLLVRELASQTLGLFEDIHKCMSSDQKIDLQSQSRELQEQLDAANFKLLELLANPLRHDAGALTNFITYSQRLKDKLENFYRAKRFNGAKITPVPAAIETSEPNLPANSND